MVKSKVRAREGGPACLEVQSVPDRGGRDTNGRSGEMNEIERAAKHPEERGLLRDELRHVVIKREKPDPVRGPGRTGRAGDVSRAVPKRDAEELGPESLRRIRENGARAQRQPEGLTFIIVHHEMLLALEPRSTGMIDQR